MFFFLFGASPFLSVYVTSYNICACDFGAWYFSVQFSADYLCMQPRTSVPEEKKDNKYWARRTKNNKAAKRSRDTRKKRMDDEIKSAKEAIAENHKLKQEIDVSDWSKLLNLITSTFWQ